MLYLGRMKIDTRSPRLRISASQYHKRKRKLKLLELLGNKCVDCGYSGHPAALDFDHIDPKTKTYAVGRLIGGKWDILLKEASKCVIRCANCHRIKTSMMV